MKEIFISHSTSDKEIVDCIIDFMLRCGISSNNIFCSSISGNGVEQRIPDEVKRAISESKINIVVLSVSYYRSPYCQNEAGIIWYQQNATPAIVIALPEITHTNMQGFLNSDNIVRRLDDRQQIMEIADIIEHCCEDFNCSAAKMSSNVDKLIREYQNCIKDRSIPDQQETSGKQSKGDSDLERRIMENEFSDGELVYLKYFYDTDDREVLDDMLRLNQWYLGENYSVPMGDIPLTTLKEDGILEEIYEEYTKQWVGHRLTLSYYRQLRKISPGCYNFICTRLNKHAVKSKGMKETWNTIDWYIHHDELTEGEKLLLRYVCAKGRRQLLSAWQAKQEIDNIEIWENELSLNKYTSQNYKEILAGLVRRKWLIASKLTSEGNPREYRWTDSAEDMIFNLGEDSTRLLWKTVTNNQLR